MSMAILIKGMEMPFTCLTCDFHKCAGGVWDFCSLTKRRQFRFKNRPKNCPLIEVPEPHGDLIDRDALPKPRVEWEDIVNAPTVIPASESKERHAFLPQYELTPRSEEGE
jgi:hypothetical protein